jgi:hypothetical protein
MEVLGMNHDQLIQCKRVIINNKKSRKFIKLTLADKMYLILLSRRLKREKNINNITFEEFVLLCKHHKTVANLRIESKYSTTFIDILQFDEHTLHSMLYKIINEIELYKDENKYNNIDDVINLLRVKPVILFDVFNEICELLNVKVLIE